MTTNEFGRHKFIRPETFKLSASYFKAIDNCLNLHYTSHTSPPSVDQILNSSSNLLSRKVTFQSLLNILALYPASYIISENHKVNDKSSFSITLPFEINHFNRSITRRNQEYVESVNSWIANNPEAQVLPICNDFLNCSKALIENNNSSDSSSKSGSPSKISKPSKSSLVDKHNLKNTTEKFKFKPKDEAIELSKSGLTLLERIKLKEKKNKELAKVDNSDIRYSNYLDGKLHPVYDILYQTYWSGSRGRRTKTKDVDDQETEKKVGVASLPLVKFVDIIRDSLSYPISEGEVEDIVVRLEETLGASKVHIITRGGITVVKVNNLDRCCDLQKIDKTT
ncbi:hypothetical protein CLIB1423_08S01420 [[Candida] railenensis]|uniref:DNA replication factor Cdt1 C-terminal domain-containing protein n=1 Tax=[Candida] railenensis TaxID=45579 RepID=A0A9P0QR11_9ASCO|nr:hypothetical protein CLIB1423_08S01420 [[Candida] railenensis]